MTPTKFGLVFAFLVVLLPSSGIAKLNLERAAILFPDQYFEFTEPIDPGTGWFALKASNASWELVPVHLRSMRVVVRNLGQVEDMKLVSDQPDALFLLRHSTLRAGKVETPRLELKDNQLRPRDGHVNIQWRGKGYRFIESGLDVEFVSDNTKTRLGQLRKANDDEYYSSLVWAGDLDRDGQLDVIVQYSSYDTQKVCLYLSSVASQGSLVKEVSCWSQGG